MHCYGRIHLTLFLNQASIIAGVELVCFMCDDFGKSSWSQGDLMHDILIYVLTVIPFSGINRILCLDY